MPQVAPGCVQVLRKLVESPTPGHGVEVQAGLLTPIPCH